jgi:uncharacterized protein YjgD (DUF1641 family)
MANPLHFKVKNVDPKHELQKRLDAAPIEHAEALLVGYDILQAAHDNGLLDLVNGLVGGRDVIAEKLAHYAKMPGGIALMRNAIAGAKILMALDPDTLDQLSKSITTATGEHRAETKPPSLFTLARRATSEDARRGLSFMTLLLGALGKSLRATPDTDHK